MEISCDTLRIFGDLANYCSMLHVDSKGVTSNVGKKSR
jgi:hypothetical protein